MWPKWGHFLLGHIMSVMSGRSQSKNNFIKTFAKIFVIDVQYRSGNNRNLMCPLVLEFPMIRVNSRPGGFYVDWRASWKW
jgi:hypothetical protein